MLTAIILPLLLSLQQGTGFYEGPVDSEKLIVLTWNLENFFDWKCDSLSTSEMEFSSSGARHWSRKRFTRKCTGIAKTVLASAARCGSVPTVLAFQEVENKGVLRRLVDETLLRKLDYRIVHFDSPDKRGIDCALLYRSSGLKLLGAAPRHLYDSRGRVLRTRDILVARFESIPSGRRVAVMVNHHPSKLGSDSGTLRNLALEVMVHLADSLSAEGCHCIVAVGDFNRPMEWMDGECRGGTLKFNGNWERIDGCALATGASVREEVLDFPFLLARDGAYGGLKPLRTYSGPRYLGGISDHLPVAVTVLPTGEN